MPEPAIGTHFRSHAWHGIWLRVGTDDRARKYKIIAEGAELSNRGEKMRFSSDQCDPCDPPIPEAAPLGKLARSPEQFAAGRKWALQQATEAEKAGHPHLAEVWRRVAKWESGEEVRVVLGAFGMADDVTRKWGWFVGFTPTGPKHILMMMPDGKRRNLPIQSAIFADLYKEGAQALDWERAYDW